MAQYGYLVSVSTDGNNHAMSATLMVKKDSDNMYSVQGGTVFKLQKEPYTPNSSNDSRSSDQGPYRGVLASMKPVTLIPTVYDDKLKLPEAIVPAGTLFTLYLPNNGGQKLLKSEENDSLVYDAKTNLFAVVDPQKFPSVADFVVTDTSPQLIVVLTYYFPHDISGLFSASSVQSRLNSDYPNVFNNNITVYVLDVPAAYTSSATDKLIGLSVTIYNSSSVQPSDVQNKLQIYFNSLAGASTYNVLPPPLV